MNISSLNPGSVKEEQMKRGIVKNLNRNKIHIAAIRETHIIQDRDYIIDKYRITTAAATKREEVGVVQGGTEIMIHGSTQKYITHITRQIIRVREVTLDHQNSNMPIQIITSYAPHNGHTEEDRRQHWREVKEILNKTCKRHMIIWRTDANGQIGRDEEEAKP